MAKRELQRVATSLASREHMAPNVASPLTAPESFVAAAATALEGRWEGRRGDDGDGSDGAAATVEPRRPVAPAAAPQIRQTSGSACIITTPVSGGAEFLLQTLKTCGSAALLKDTASALAVCPLAANQ